MIICLAALLHDQGTLGEAEPLCREALTGSRLTLGDEHPPHTLSSINNFAGLLDAQGKLTPFVGVPWVTSIPSQNCCWKTCSLRFVAKAAGVSLT